MSDVAVTQIDGQNFQLLNCLHVVNSERVEEGQTDEPAIEEMLRPLRENYEDSLLEDFKSKIKRFFASAFKKEESDYPFRYRTA